MAKNNGQLEGKPNMKNSIQDLKTHEYLQSLANFIEIERVTLQGFLNQIIKAMTKAVEKKFDEAEKTVDDIIRQKD